MSYGLNPRVALTPGSLIRALNEKKKPTSIDLGLGEPTLPPTMTYLERATAWVARHGCRYTANAGDPELREAIAAHYRYPALGAAENVIATIGSQEAVYLAIKALLEPGKDALLVVEPVFPVYAKCAQMEGIAAECAALAPEDDFAFDADRIAAAVGPQTRMIVVCSPCNPTARVITRSQAQRLAELLLRRGGEPVYVLHDEVYRELLFGEEGGRIADFYPHTVVVNSLSKSNALTGMRIGWVMAPKAVAPTMVKAHAWLVSTANTFAQRVALEIFRAGALQEHLEWYRAQRAAALAALQAAGLRHLPIEGSFYAAVRLGEGIASLEFCRRLVETDDVVAIPGSAFGASLEGWLRCSWVAPPERAAEGFRRIAAALQVTGAGRVR
jgi:aminotransferase